MAPRDRQRFRERFRREPRVEANGGGERKLMKIRDLSRHAAPLRQIVRKLTFDRILFSTEPRPATLCGPAAFESPDKSFNPFPPQRGGGWLLCFLTRRWPGILALCPSLCFPPLGKNTGKVLFSDGF